LLTAVFNAPWSFDQEGSELQLVPAARAGPAAKPNKALMQPETISLPESMAVLHQAVE
jgi:hypothetical protein